MQIMGIDPGLGKGKLGYVVIKTPEFLTADQLKKVENGYLSLGRIITGGVMNGPKRNKNVLQNALQVAQELLAIAKAHQVILVYIEDFSFRGNHSDERKNLEKATVGVVSDMRLLIGYLKGFLEANGLLVKLIPPAWKIKARAISGGGDQDFCKWLYHHFPELKEFVSDIGEQKRQHLYSAVGIAVFGW